MTTREPGPANLDRTLYDDGSWTVALDDTDDDYDVPEILLIGEELTAEQAAAIGRALLDAVQVVANVEQVRGG